MNILTTLLICTVLPFISIIHRYILSVYHICYVMVYCNVFDAVLRWLIIAINWIFIMLKSIVSLLMTIIVLRKLTILIINFLIRRLPFLKVSVLKTRTLILTFWCNIILLILRYILTCFRLRVNFKWHRYLLLVCICVFFII